MNGWCIDIRDTVFLGRKKNAVPVDRNFFFGQLVLDQNLGVVSFGEFERGRRNSMVNR
jgi:hypothetical protein